MYIFIIQIVKQVFKTVFKRDFFHCSTYYKPHSCKAFLCFGERCKFHCKATVLTLGTKMSEQFNKSPLAAITGVINRLLGSLNLNQCCCALIVPEALVAAVTGANLLALTEHSHKKISPKYS